MKSSRDSFSSFSLTEIFDDVHCGYSDVYLESGHQAVVPVEREYLEGERVDTVCGDTGLVEKLENGSTVGLITLLLPLIMSQTIRMVCSDDDFRTGSFRGHRYHSSGRVR